MRIAAPALASSLAVITMTAGDASCANATEETASKPSTNAIRTNPLNAKQPLHNPSDAPKWGRFTYGPSASLVFTPSPWVGLINDWLRLR